MQQDIVTVRNTIPRWYKVKHLSQWEPRIKEVFGLSSQLCKYNTYNYFYR